MAPYSIPIFLDFLLCDGSESTLLDCQPISHGLHECSSRETVNLQCTGKFIRVKYTLISCHPHYNIDINECEINNGGCHHNCVNTVGSFYCTCYHRHSLDSDGMTCLGTTCSVYSYGFFGYSHHWTKTNDPFS